MDVKICGITLVDDLRAIDEAGANYAGFICCHASKRFVTLDKLKEMAKISTNLKRVGVFVNATYESICQAIEVGRLDVVQLHGTEEADFAKKLRGIEIWKAVHLTAECDIENNLNFPAERFVVDYATGGSGKICDWSLAKEMTNRKSIMLAGGITPENCVEAIQFVKPRGIDIASGVELSPGIKNLKKIKRLFEEIHSIKDEK